MKETKKSVGTFKSFDGTKIYYEVRGSGKPIIFCYGLACVMNHWIHQSKYFSNEYQTVLFDYRGHHASDRPSDPNQLSLESLARDLNALMEHLQIEKASLWGHSFGVQMLVQFYQLFAPKVHDFVFINGFVNNPIKGMFGIDFLPTAFAQFQQTQKKYPELVRFLWKNIVSNSALHPLASLAGGFNLHLTKVRDIEVYARGVANIDLDIFTALFGQMMEFDGRPFLPSIAVPTLIVSGAKDGVTPKGYQTNMHQLIEGSQFISVPYGSHCTQLDLPELVNLRAEKFLRDTGWVADKRTKK